MLHVALVEPEIAWNTGNAGRTCLAAGARLHLVGPLGFSLDEKRLRRAGLDYWEFVAPELHPDLAEFEERIPSLGRPYFFSAEAGRSLYDTRIEEHAVFLFGKESVGFSDSIRERYRDQLVRIPQFDPRIRSLNLSTCIGIAVYEAVRQKTS